MDIKNIIQAWKNPLYRKQFTAEELALLPANPAGVVELSEAELKLIQGAELGTGGSCATVGHCNLTHGGRNCATDDCPGGNTEAYSGCNTGPDGTTLDVDCNNTGQGCIYASNTIDAQFGC